MFKLSFLLRLDQYRFLPGISNADWRYEVTFLNLAFDILLNKIENFFRMIAELMKIWLHIRNKEVWKFERRIRWWNWTCPHLFLPRCNFPDAVQIFTAKFIYNFATPSSPDFAGWFPENSGRYYLLDKKMAFRSLSVNLSCAKKLPQPRSMTHGLDLLSWCVFFLIECQR